MKMNLKNKKVTVVGLGKSGVAACNFLLEKGARVNITDCLDNQQIRKNVSKLNKKNINRVEIGRHTEDLIDGQDLVVTSPGVAKDSRPLFWAREKAIPVIGEVELAFSFCPAPIVAITGTNGKTTVCTLVGQIFRAAGHPCVVCGNIGTPFCGELTQITNKHIVVLEVSSFQLETIDKFKPKVAVILNLSIDHLNRYANSDEYFNAKCRIFSNQSKVDWAVINREDPRAFALAEKTKAKVLYFPKKPSLNKFSYLNKNHLAALAICSPFAVAEDVAINTCLRFKGIEHRIEEITQVRGVKFINDSKATNVDSTLWALDTIQEPIILIAGGRDKGCDFAILRKKVKHKIKALVLLGEAKEKIEKAFGDLVLTKKTGTIAHAVREAFSLANPGDCILLSPMCASFDMFSDYKERGKAFKQAVRDLV